MGNEGFKFIIPERFVSTVFLHCSASNNPLHDHVQVIRQWHIEKGWSDIGYHYFIRTDGVIQRGRNIEKQPAAQKGHNLGSIAICLHGLNEEDFTEEQYKALILLCGQIDHTYGHKISFHGHREVSSKLCPVFDYKRVLNLNEHGKYDAGGDFRPSSSIERNRYFYDTFSSGDEVREIQLKLNTWILGTKIPGEAADHYLIVDGFYGPATGLIVTRFQKANNLYTDGIVGPATLKRLDDFIESLNVSETIN